MCACNSNTSNEVILPENEIIPLTKEEEIIKLYNQSVLPLYKEYSDVEIPTEFKIDKNDLGINAGASFGYVEVSQGLINLTKKDIQLFALTHEVAHIVTLSQANKFNLQGSIPENGHINEYKKSEYLADLIAIHLIKSQNSLYFQSIKNNFNILKSILGTETYTHPSGENRVKLMNDYIELSKRKIETIAFKEIYLKIWKDDYFKND